ncbi:MAG TPA: hypothetical protein VN843_06780, partial [Anaerolineales bacterium]|nr:hypothetical protein [Anaerolineales bacterium]
MDEKYEFGTTRAFMEIFSRTEMVQTYNPAWENETKYLDHASKMVVLEPGKLRISITPENRRVIFVGT